MQDLRSMTQPLRAYLIALLFTMRIQHHKTLFFPTRVGTQPMIQHLHVRLIRFLLTTHSQHHEALFLPTWVLENEDALLRWRHYRPVQPPLHHLQTLSLEPNGRSLSKMGSKSAFFLCTLRPGSFLSGNSERLHRTTWPPAKEWLKTTVIH
jgi:hypothetical protein